MMMMRVAVMMNGCQREKDYRMLSVAVMEGRMLLILVMWWMLMDVSLL